MGLFEVATFLLGIDVRRHMETDLIAGDEGGEADADFGLIGEVEDTPVEPQPEEPGEVPSVLSQERQAQIAELIQQLDGGYRRRYRK